MEKAIGELLSHSALCLLLAKNVCLSLGLDAHDKADVANTRVLFCPATSAVFMIIKSCRCYAYSEGCQGPL